jgi:RHS repeat-associated protein
MLMPGRTFKAGTSTNYRYGFNGKENDNEVKGVGNEIDYGMRYYDPRVGRFMSVDPDFESFPWNSGYAYAENDVIRSTDLDGLEKSVSTMNFSVSAGKTVMNHISDNYVQPEGTFHIGFQPKTTKEIIAQALVTCLKTPKLPENGDFVFVEFADHPNDNSALYYYTNSDGQPDVHAFANEDILWMYGQLGIAQENLSKGMQVAGAVANLLAAGSLAKSELSTVSNELKQSVKEASLSTGSGPISGVLEVSNQVKSVAAFKNYTPSESVEFVYDPVNQKFLVGRPNESVEAFSGHQKLAKVGNMDPSKVVGGLFRRGPNGEIVTNEHSGHYYQNWTDAIRKSFKEFLEQKTGQKVIHTTGL